MQYFSSMTQVIITGVQFSKTTKKFKMRTDYLEIPVFPVRLIRTGAYGSIEYHVYNPSKSGNKEFPLFLYEAWQTNSKSLESVLFLSSAF